MIRSTFLRGLAFGLLWWILAEGRLDGWLLGGVAVAAGAAGKCRNFHDFFSLSRIR